LIKLRDGTTILDTGSDIRVKSGHITTETVGVMAAACASRGFKSVDLSGDVQFKNAMAIELAMREPPIAVNNFKMSDLARRTLDERKIERAEKRAKDKPQDVDDYFRRIVASGRPIADLPDAAQIEVRRRHRAFLSANEATADDVPVELYMQGAKVAQDRVEAQNAPRQTTMAPANDETVDNNVGNRRAKR
jgi:hypothetical protein